MRFKRLKNRIHAFVLSLLTIILILVMLLVNRANMNNASDQVLQDIRANGNIFLSAVNETRSHLIVAARLLSSDFAFKKAYATYDQATIRSAMNNHLSRLEHADIMFIMDIDDGVVVADSRDERGSGQDSPIPSLLVKAEEDDYLEASGYESLDGVLYQFVVVPLLVPDPVAWIAIGFRIDDDYVTRFKELSSSDVSLYIHTTENSDIVASTLSAEMRKQLLSWLVNHREGNGASLVEILGENHLTHKLALGDSPITGVLQRSQDEALRPYLQLQYALVIVFLVAIIAAYIGSLLLARNIARPIRTLSSFAQRIERGHYSSQISVNNVDEIGELANSFNHMAKGLEEKDKVRNLLGKVVSPEIAKQLIDKGVKLGGEEKLVTVLFSDMRNFTALCEGRNATDILELLNLYLNEMSQKVEENHGVVDKYIGDAMMALYGAPLSSNEDATNAVLTALQMKDTLVQVNEDFASRGLPVIDIGIGINTDNVVAGNMGSASRLNYTVIGDGVNIASRIEGLTKHYGVKILVTESTRHNTNGIDYREIDRVRVKGKLEPVVIYEPYRAEHETDFVQVAEKYHQALSAYQGCDWSTAIEGFGALNREYPGEKLYQVYLQRCEQLRLSPPQGEWDGVYTFKEK